MAGLSEFIVSHCFEHNIYFHKWLLLLYKLRDFIFTIVRTVVKSLYQQRNIVASKIETFYASSKITASDFVGFLELSRTLPFKMSSKLDPGLYDPELDPGR